MAASGRSSEFGHLTRSLWRGEATRRGTATRNGMPLWSPRTRSHLFFCYQFVCENVGVQMHGAHVEVRGQLFRNQFSSLFWDRIPCFFLSLHFTSPAGNPVSFLVYSFSYILSRRGSHMCAFTSSCLHGFRESDKVRFVSQVPFPAELSPWPLKPSLKGAWTLMRLGAGQKAFHLWPVFRSESVSSLGLTVVGINMIVLGSLFAMAS